MAASGDPPRIETPPWTPREKGERADKTARLPHTPYFTLFPHSLPLLPASPGAPSPPGAAPPPRLLTAPSPPSACPGGRPQPSAGPGSAPRAHGQRQQPPPGPGGHGGRRRRRPPRAGGDPEPGGGGGGGRGGGGAAHPRQPPEGGKCPPRAPQRPQILSLLTPKGGRSPPWGLGVTPSCSSSLLFPREAPKYK